MRQQASLGLFLEGDPFEYLNHFDDLTVTILFFLMEVSLSHQFVS